VLQYIALLGRGTCGPDRVPALVGERGGRCYSSSTRRSAEHIAALPGGCCGPDAELILEYLEARPGPLEGSAGADGTETCRSTEATQQKVSLTHLWC